MGAQVGPIQANWGHHGQITWGQHRIAHIGPTVVGPFGPHEKNQLGPIWVALAITHGGGQLGLHGAYLVRCLGCACYFHFCRSL